MNQKVLVLSLQKINIVYACMATCLVLLALYFFLAINTALLVAEKNSYDDKAVALRSQLSELEQEYIEVTGNISIDLAYEMGFEENLKETVFITRTNSAAAFLTE